MSDVSPQSAGLRGQRPQIFLNHASEDGRRVSILYEQLQRLGYAPWMDRRDNMGGIQWRKNINRMIRNSHFFLACLSVTSVAKEGVVKQEQDIALEVQPIFPPDVAYIIPVRLELCDLPQNLDMFQWIDLFAADGFEQLCRAIDTGMQKRSPHGRETGRVYGFEERSIVLHGAIALPILPEMRVSVTARLYAEHTETFVHPDILVIA